jgi:hypothetical protein
MSCCGKKTGKVVTTAKAAAMPSREPFLDMRIRRAACRNCVIKHLSAALAISPEVLLGYPENAEIAAKHAELAFSHARGEDAAAIMPAIAAYSGWRRDKAIEHIHRAHKSLQDALSGLGVPLARARVIGHLVNAEEECWAADPALAERIRVERLKFMDDDKYEVDFTALGI